MRNVQLFILLLIPLCLAAQQQPHYIIGTEAGVDFRKFEPGLSRNIHYVAGITLEHPIGKFSVGTGLLYKSFGEFYSQEYNGYSAVEVIEEEAYTFYYFDERLFNLEYYSVPLRIQFRLPCNCVYLQAGIHADIARFGAKRPQEDRFKTIAIPEDFHFNRDEGLKRVSLSYELAIGFKLHFNDKLRMFMRPTYRIIPSPAKRGSSQLTDNYRSLHLAMGLQRAL